MKKANKVNFIISGILFLFFILLIVLLRTTDIRAIGPEASLVGLATINNAISKFIGTNMTLYNITDWLGFVAIIIAIGFAVFGIIQLIVRKSIKKVDFRLLILGAFYIVVVLFYILFEVIVINYRPIILDGKLAPSFPSTTTLTVLCIMITAMIQFNYLIKNKPLKIIIQIISGLILAISIIGRFMSGVHWFTDIIGGLLLGTALVLLYYNVINIIENKKSNNALSKKDELKE